jgi:hypothetical protein
VAAEFGSVYGAHSNGVAADREATQVFAERSGPPQKEFPERRGAADQAAAERPEGRTSNGANLSDTVDITAGK